jgi:hypothetical protein
MPQDPATPDPAPDVPRRDSPLGGVAPPDPARAIRVTRLSDQGKDDDLRTRTSEECFDLVWQVTLDAWAMKGEPVVESPFPRHVVRIVRRKR